MHRSCNHSPKRRPSQCTVNKDNLFTVNYTVRAAGLSFQSSLNLSLNSSLETLENSPQLLCSHFKFIITKREKSMQTGEGLMLIMERFQLYVAPVSPSFIQVQSNSSVGILNLHCLLSAQFPPLLFCNSIS